MQHLHPFQLILGAGVLTLVAANARDIWQHVTGTHWCDHVDETGR
ncbi:MAG: hypothetical protein AAGA65_23905 [Actinomycetota bacterium]